MSEKIDCYPERRSCGRRSTDKHLPLWRERFISATLALLFVIAVTIVCPLIARQLQHYELGLLPSCTAQKPPCPSQFSITDTARQS